MTATAVREKPILFSGEMVRAILSGRKTQTRRVVKPQPDIVYCLSDDTITADCNITLSTRVIHETDQAVIWNYLAGDTGISKRRLYGGERWASVFQDEICRIWSEGFRGLVSSRRSQDKKRIHLDFVVPQQCSGDEKRASFDLHGFPRNATDGDNASASSGWKSGKQQAGQFGVGHATGELDRQGGARTRYERREAPPIETDERRARAYSLGSENRAVQSATCRSGAWNVAGCDSKRLPWIVGQRLWVRESFLPCKQSHPVSIGDATYACFRDGSQKFLSGKYYHDPDPDRPKVNWPKDAVWRPSIHMPRWASRILLEVTEVRVERLKEITQEDILAEGITLGDGVWAGGMTVAFRELWDRINGKTHPWDSSPWVWAVSFKVLEPTP